jgi:signal transduction histidine kinase
MRALRNIPIHRKLTIITLLTSGVTLLLACFAFVTFEVFVERVEMVDDLLTTADMTGFNCSAALAFNDLGSAAETLNSLKAHPRVVGGVVYDKNGNVFAVYRRADVKKMFNPPAVEPDGHRFTGRSLGLFHGIRLAGESAGTVYIESDLDEMYARLLLYALIVGIVMIVASFVAYLLSRRLQRVISGPISHLAGVVGVVAREKNYSVRAVKEGEDEMGQLIDGFNDMLIQIQTQNAALQEARDNLELRVSERTAELNRIHGQLIEASRRGGMAEIAANVLHNVGNALTSVNVSINLIMDGAKNSKVASLARVVALIREHANDLGAFVTSDPQGKQLPGYLAQLSEHLLADQDATVKEIGLLQKNISHIKEIVAMQQSYATVLGVKEVVDIKSLVEDSLRINAGALSRHGVQIIRDFGDVPPMNVDKNKILQIMVNLVRNAKYACDESGRDDKRVTIRIAREDGHLTLSVTDNGVGISLENLTRIFSHGFTTRKGGHGFGLHGSALAAKEMGGSLSVHSDGVGRGAAFTLELPFRRSEDRNG